MVAEAIECPFSILLAKIDHASAWLRLGRSVIATSLPLGGQERNVPSVATCSDYLVMLCQSERQIGLESEMSSLKDNLRLRYQLLVVERMNLCHWLGTSGKCSGLRAWPTAHPTSSYGTRDDPNHVVPLAT